MYTNIIKYIQDTPDIYKMPGGGGPAWPRGARAGPGPLGAGPGRRRLAATWYVVYILFIYIYIYMYCIYLYIFVNISIYCNVFGIDLVSNWY